MPGWGWRASSAPRPVASSAWPPPAGPSTAPAPCSTSSAVWPSPTPPSAPAPWRPGRRCGRGSAPARPRPRSSPPRPGTSSPAPMAPRSTRAAAGGRCAWPSSPSGRAVLDIYHVGAHLHGAARILYGEGAAEGTAWVDARRLILLQGGATALEVALAAQEQSLRSPRKRQALADLRAYLAPHAGHTGYAGRLGRGQSIGSGMVEGACKTVVGRRLKQTGARWRVRHAEQMVALCGLLYSDLWEEYRSPEQN